LKLDDTKILVMCYYSRGLKVQQFHFNHGINEPFLMVFSRQKGCPKAFANRTMYLDKMRLSGLYLFILMIRFLYFV